MPKFFIEQIALCPPDVDKAIKLLSELGLSDWVHDIVVAKGQVHGTRGVTNVAELSFNYQASRGLPPNSAVEKGQRVEPKAIELELLNYTAGTNWMVGHGHVVSHLGMHCTDAELQTFIEVFKRWGIPVAQAVNTQSHVNPAIAGQRWYTYVIYNTRSILGVDLKFIIRRDEPVKTPP